MTWETRSGTKGRYYVRSKKVEGRVRKEYVGRFGDPITQVIAAGDKLDRAEAAEVVSEVRSEQAQYRILEPYLTTIADGVGKAVEATLVAIGYRRRRGKIQRIKTRSRNVMNRDAEAADEPVTQELFEHLCHKANYGDQDAADRLRQILGNHPEIWEEIGDLTRHSERCLIDLIAEGGNEVLAESVRLRAEKLKSYLLAEATDQSLERLLVDDVVLCWIGLEYTRVAAVQPQQFKQDSGFWARRHGQAHKRYLAAVKELATVRGLLRGEHVVIREASAHSP